MESCLLVFLETVFVVGNLDESFLWNPATPQVKESLE